jgi:ribosomal protein S18 acetylase RimI-like enzyme
MLQGGNIYGSPGDLVDQTLVKVTYLEMWSAPTAFASRDATEQVTEEKLSLEEYLTLYRRVGVPLRWDQRLQMPRQELAALLRSSLRIYVLRDARHDALGFCEFDRGAFPETELKNFGLVPEAQGRGLGPWLLAMALRHEWSAGPQRIWLHTDTWDHPAAIPLYERAGFRVFAVRDEPAGPL